jgi:hypothetical protein
VNNAAVALAEANRCGCPTVQAFALYAAAEACADDDSEHAAVLLRDAMTTASSVAAGFVANLARLTLANLTARQGDRVAALAHYPAIMQQWRRTDQWPQLWNTIRTLVPILTDVGRSIDAAMLLGGLRANQTTPTWGPDADAIAEAGREVQRQLGDDGYADALARGQAFTPLEIVMLAERAAARASGCPEPPFP